MVSELPVKYVPIGGNPDGNMSLALHILDNHEEENIATAAVAESV